QTPRIVKPQVRRIVSPARSYCASILYREAWGGQMESRRLGAAVVLIAMLMALPAAAQRVIDGDTIDLNGTRWRLWGIDAPETHQSCADGWPAGIEATASMRGMVSLWLFWLRQLAHNHCLDAGWPRRT